MMRNRSLTSRWRIPILTGGASALVFGVLISLSTAGPVNLAAASTASTTTCTATGFVKDGINLTAALINRGKVTGTVNATGCNIGIYYGPASTGQVQHADVFGANYYGIVNNGGNVNVMNSSVHNIGEVPFNGDQHGVGIYFAYGSASTGSIINNTVSQYQKGGIVVNGGSAQIQNNTVTGLGPVDFIAGNGIQIGYGATGTIANNSVSGNAYTGTNNASSAGILVFGGCGYALSTGVDIHSNTLVNNDIGVALANYDPTCTTQPSQMTNEVVHNNMLTNNAITNVSGNGYPQGYQAGILDVGNGDSIHNNTISGIGYTPPQNTPTIVVVPIDTSLATNPMLHNNTIQ